ncbi:MAG: EcsC family protein [Chitinophagaceae bacterium]
MDAYILTELKSWQHQMQKRPTVVDALSKSVQNRINAIIPEKVHAAITTVIKKMVLGVLFGARYTSPKSPQFANLTELEAAVDRRIEFYKKTAAAEGGITGAGGFLAAMADFPLLLSQKLKMLFDIAALYGYDVKDYKERLYILHIFGIAFSSQKHRRNVYYQMEHWDQKKATLPDDVAQFEWRSFQQEYRDYIDLAKLAQMIPGVGAVVGFVVNYRMLKKLGQTAKNAYRMRLVQQMNASSPVGKL